MPPVLYKLVQQCDVMLSPKILKRSDKLRKMKVRAIETAFPHFLSCKICLKCCSLCLIHISISCIHSYLAKSPETCSHRQTQRLLFCLPPSWLLAAFDTVELSNLKHFLILASVTLNFSDFDHLPLHQLLFLNLQTLYATSKDRRAPGPPLGSLLHLHSFPGWSYQVLRHWIPSLG